MFRFPSASLILLLPAALCAEPVDFNRDIRPIFNRHCIACHGGVKQASDISFVYRDQIVGGKGESGYTIVEPGQPDESELIFRITTDDSNARMPPADEHPEGLTTEEIDILTRWVEQGAPWEEHWAFEPPQPQRLPEVSDPSWPKQTWDRFVLARLNDEGIEPAEEASPERWLRRVTLDLTGLPPTLKERSDFLEALEKQGESAYASVVDRLLMSPRFGERWASVWLDQVRYADSKGLGQDGRRNIWKYRDWVIQAFNRDLPYDEFTIQQLAGDLLPEPTMEHRLATAMHRATQTNEEGGTDDEEFRIEALIDRVSTTWQAWQGVTFGCVQCHNHPYDPIRHEEYYEFADFFNNTADTDLNEDWPSARVPLDPGDYDKAAELDQRISKLRQSIWKEEFAHLNNEKNWRPVRDLNARTSNQTRVTVKDKGNHQEYHTVDTVSRDTDITLEAALPEDLEALTAIRVTGMPLNPEEAVANPEWGFVQSHIEAKLIPADDDSEPIKIPLVRVIGDESDPFHDPNESLNPESNRGFSAYTRIHYPRQAALILEKPLSIPEGARLQVTLKHRIFTLGAFPLITRRGHLAVSDNPEWIALMENPDLNDRKNRLAALVNQRQEIPSTSIPVIEERPEHLKRPTHVFERGLFLTKAQEVKADVPESFPELPEDRPANRLALAEWLVAEENPLTARVAVNRFWSRLFGVGLVATEEDFGSSGDPPSHPALLDYLALRFQNDLDWSVKSLLREMVLSATYRQRSAIRPEIHANDPMNRLLAMGPRHRLPAETIRDQSLAMAGLLSDKMYGWPVHPPIPEGVWNPFQGGDRWRTPEPGDEDRYRRSVYTYTKRSIPYPMFATFDRPSREFCTPRRLRSNTPLQSLMLLNDQTMTECARALGQRMKNEFEGTLDDKLATGFLLATGREADEVERKELRDLFDNTQDDYWADPGQRKEAGMDPDDAAFSMVATVLLNLDEVLMK